MTTVDAELKRRGPDDELLADALVADAASDNGYAQPVADGGVRDALAAGVRLRDEVGTLISPGNPLPVDVGGSISIENLSVSFESVVSTLNSRTTPLAADEVFTGAWEDVLSYAAITAAISTDAASATNGAVIQFSADGVNVTTYRYSTVPAGAPGFFVITPEARYFRIVYTNGPVAQTVLSVQVGYQFNAPSVPQGLAGGQLTDLSVVGVVRSVLSARHGSGAYLPLSYGASGGLVVEGPLTDTQLRASEVEVRDDYQGGEVLADQTGAGAVLTFTFSSPVQLVLVHAYSATAADLARVDPFGGTPSASAGIRALNDVPTFVPVTATTVRVFAPTGMEVSVSGFRRA